jgi:hypothetical protein
MYFNTFLQNCIYNIKNNLIFHSDGISDSTTMVVLIIIIYFISFSTKPRINYILYPLNVKIFEIPKVIIELIFSMECLSYI